MAFINDLTLATENHVQKYCKKVSKKYNIEYDELYEIWKEIPDPYTPSIPTKEGKAKKERVPSGKRGPSNWNIFCSKNREQVKDENPGLKAAEINKILGEMWGKLDEKEKEKYSSNSDVPQEIVHCTYILISGPRTGEQCGQKATKNGKCTRHFNIINGNNGTGKKESPKKAEERGKKERKIPIDILTLKKDKQGNIYHPDTKLAFDNDKNVIGKYNGGSVKKVRDPTDYDLEQLKIIQKYTLQVLGVET